ncbi:tRNA isopentenyl-2-thiomethyl-A-37 hydroxylase MiaE [Congregibacter brevis]|uniref:tRNA isopentenyl-2-thiomethyl-A-37 hydroxylase MiaE n=1 Tax=Congregibacter brevis TaxID=3081201 RepID=A0ABZ0IHJ5_9GAMM|nr:tRNA isopentenyl-2-thiomethyl-A-37 hydroxylase MiaE [Congregibacter sp. IMCC45268]
MMVSGVDMSPIREFLLCDTPAQWIEAAGSPQNLHTLLVDHANCEKKAASTALNLMYRYVEHPELLHKLSRLAREELRHFEQVLAIVEKRGFSYPQLTASGYAAGLRAHVAKNEPYRLLDTLLVGAIIEARSCERFAAVIPVVDEELGQFYASLLRSESRHFKDYLTLAEDLLPALDLESRLAALLEAERDLIQAVDGEFRFHSGVPAR